VVSELINPRAVVATREIGIDVTQKLPKPWTDEILRAADYVISVGMRDSCPLFPGKHYEDWDLKHPDGQTLQTVREIRDDIDEQVRNLVERFRSNASPAMN